MANWTYPINTEHNVDPNITIHQILKDGVLDGWRALANDSYVFYDTTAEDFDWTTMTPVTYYYTRVDFPKTFNFDNFTWIAVPRSEVDENYIFGSDNN